MKVGDVVYLKSGGPSMVVYEEQIGPDGDSVNCMWFTTDHQLKNDWIPIACLVEGHSA